MATLIILDDDGNEKMRESGDVYTAWIGSWSDEFKGAITGRGMAQGTFEERCRMVIMQAADVYSKTKLPTVDAELKRRRNESEARDD
jgi:hypothetical protein